VIAPFFVWILLDVVALVVLVVCLIVDRRRAAMAGLLALLCAIGTFVAGESLASYMSVV
jgi:hypothetical protein